MEPISIAFTKLQIEEITHKACIIRDEADLQESYGLTQCQADAFADAFLAFRGSANVHVRPEWLDAIVGELENLIDIAKDNMDFDGEPGEHLAYIKSLRGAIKKVRAAT